MADKFSGGLDTLTRDAADHGLLQVGFETALGLGALAAKGAGALMRETGAMFNGVELNVGRDTLTSLGSFLGIGTNSNEPSLALARGQEVQLAAPGHDHQIGELTPTVLSVNLQEIRKSKEQEGAMIA